MPLFFILSLCYCTWIYTDSPKEDRERSISVWLRVEEEMRWTDQRLGATAQAHQENPVLDVSRNYHSATM